MERPLQIRQSLILALLVTACSLSAQQAPKGVAEPHLAAGLRNLDGTAHAMPAPHKTTGRTLDVTQFGADPADNEKDDQPALNAAMNEAKPGDEIYFPNGTYNLRTSSDRHPDAHILLKPRVNVRGQSEAGVKLISSFDAGSSSRGYSVIKGVDISDVHVSHLTISSTWNRNFSSNPRVSNPDRGGPLYGVAIDGALSRNERLTFEHLTIERFARMAIRIAKGSSYVVIRNCTAQLATDVAAGGSGYGFVIQGPGNATASDNPFLGKVTDTFFNVIENSRAIGPYIRHGALIQYWAHQNAIRHNTFIDNVYDAIDLHGEDEYLNEVHHNTITGTSQGAGIGIGNSGAGHDKTGPWNWIHHNTVTNSKRGLTAEYGTQANVIEDNIFQGSLAHEDSHGLSLGSIQNFIVRRNSIINNTAPKFIGIRLWRNRAEGTEPSGVTSGTLFENNTISGNTGAGARAVVIEEQGEGNVWRGNIVRNNSDNTAP
jgi:hypothetical protein